jgi:hypothetical protein
LGAGLTDEKFLETGSGHGNGNGLEERTPFHGGSLKSGKGKTAKDSGAGDTGQERFTGGRELARGRFRNPAAFG